jgi:hypothetical protein
MKKSKFMRENLQNVYADENTYPSASTNRPRQGIFLHYCRPAVIFESLLD